MKKAHKALCVLAIIWILALFCFGIFISQIDHLYALQLFGSEQALTGQTFALRLSARDLKYHQTAQIHSATVALWNGDRLISKTPLQERADVFLQANLNAPAEPGRYRLNVEAKLQNEIELQAEAFLIVHQTPQFSVNASEPSHAYVERKGPVLLELYPIEGAVSSGLPSRLLLRATENAKPVETQINIQWLEGRSARPLPTTLQTGKDGLAEWTLDPREPVLKGRFTVEGTEPSSAEPRILPQATQFVFEALSPIHHQNLPLRIRSLYQQGIVFIDLFYHNYWIYTTSATLSEGQARVQLPLPAFPENPAPIWVQAYRSAFLPGEARAARHILSSDEANLSTLERLIHAYHNAFRDLDVDLPTPQASIERQANFLLSLLPAPTNEPPLLCDSSETTRQEVATFQKLWKTRILIALIASTLVLFAFIFIQLRKNTQQTAQAWHEAGGDEDGDPGNRRHGPMLMILFFVLLGLFLFGLLELYLQVLWK